MAKNYSINELLEITIANKATDLHLTCGVPPTLRIDGILTPVPNQSPLTSQQTKDLTYSLLSEARKQALERERELDFSFSFKEKARFRANVFYEKNNIACALRFLPTKISTIQELGLPPVLEDFTGHSQGFVLITGPTGHGKTTTLAALISKINKERNAHIITIEDPIEYIHKHEKSIVVQREIRQDTHSFARALRSVLREDPNVVLIGEMRDLETISAALTIAETGHLVFSTLHTNNAAETVDRVIDVFPPHQQHQVRTQLANTLLGVVSQRLIPKIGGGRVVASEVLFVNSAIRNLIREGKSYQINNVIQTSAAANMISLDKTLAKLVIEGKISLDSADMYAIDQKYLRSLVKGKSKESL